MRTNSTPDFKTQSKIPKANRTTSDWYDLEYDRVLIEQSIAKQYGILPSEQGNLRYADWAKLVGGLMDDTPLLRIVDIRRETDADVIRRMTPEQLRIRSEWRSFEVSRCPAKVDEKAMKERQKQLQAMIAAMFG